MDTGIKNNCKPSQFDTINNFVTNLHKIQLKYFKHTRKKKKKISHL